MGRYDTIILCDEFLLNNVFCSSEKVQVTGAKRPEGMLLDMSEEHTFVLPLNVVVPPKEPNACMHEALCQFNKT